MKWVYVVLVAAALASVFWAGDTFGVNRTTVKYQAEDNAALEAQNKALAKAMQDLENANRQTVSLIAEVQAMPESDNGRVGPILDRVLRGLYERQEARRRARDGLSGRSRNSAAAGGWSL